MKNKRFALLALAFFSTIHPASTAFAQGTAFTYQGRLVESGNAYTGNAEFQATLWTVPSGGSALSSNSPVSVVVGVTNGLFVLPLNFGTSFPGADRWLQLEVRTNAGAFTTLPPRQQLTPTPYAITAVNLTGTLPASQLSGAIAPINIANGTISSAMLATGAVGSNQLAIGAVTTTALADGAITSSKFATSSNWTFGVTLTKPQPTDYDGRFAYAVAGLGSDRVLVGAINGVRNFDPEKAYLFDTKGALLATCNNPRPFSGSDFGSAVAAVGIGAVLVGAPRDYELASSTGAGSAFLFNTNGTLLTTFTNPVPADSDYFGNALAALGNDRVLIGAPNGGFGPTDPGAAYLFRTNGTLLATFNNPTPVIGDSFGSSLTAVGSDRVLIGAPFDGSGASNAGAAYLFNTNGTLLVTFANPTPASNDYFGISVAALGTDRVLISAHGDDTGATDAGVAYLFSTNGTLLTTFTNPAPAVGDNFGNSLAAVGTDRVLIGAYLDDIGAPNGGAAYLFTTNGVLITTFTSPTSTDDDAFGSSVAALGSDTVVIAAYQDSTAPFSPGAAYLFLLEHFAPGVIADGVHDGSIKATDFAIGAVTTAALANGAVTAAKVSPEIALRAGGNTFTGAQTFNDQIRLNSVDGFGQSSLGNFYVDAPGLIGGRFSVLAGGNVGIGVPTPEQRLSVAGGMNIDHGNANNGTIANTLRFGGASGEGIASKRTAGGNQYGLDFYTSSANRMSIANNGNVTITPGSLFFGSQTRQMLNLWGSQYGLGVQANTMYFRADGFGAGAGFAWYKGGAHSDTQNDSGGGTTLMRLDNAGNLYTTGTVNPPSDRNMKENFKPVDAGAVLEKVAALPLTEWNYKEDRGFRHVGPMAQDFHAAFGLGTDDKHIATVDADGVALAAIQGLNQKLEEKDARITALERELSQIKRLLKLPDARLNRHSSLPPISPP